MRRRCGFYGWYDELQEKAAELEAELQEVTYLKGKDLSNFSSTRSFNYSSVESAAERELKLKKQLERIKFITAVVEAGIQNALIYDLNLNGRNMVIKRIEGVPKEKIKLRCTRKEADEGEKLCIERIKELLDINHVKYLF